MTDTTPVPSREAVEAYFKRGPKDGMFTAWVAEGHAMLRILYAEVERLTNELAFERRDRAMADAAAESLRAEVERLNLLVANLQSRAGGYADQISMVLEPERDRLRATVAEQGAALRSIRDLLEGENYTAAAHCVADDALAKQTP